MKKHKRQQHEIGNAFIEMMLFVPVAVLSFFLVADAGFVYVEKAAIVDAVRSGVNSQLLETKQHWTMKRSSVELDDAYERAVENVVHRVAGAVYDNVLAVQGYQVGDIPDSFQVTVRAVEIPIDAGDGKLDSGWRGSLSSVHTVTHGNFDIHAEIPGYPVVAEDNFIEDEIVSLEAIPGGGDFSSGSQDGRPSAFALRLAPVYTALGHNEPQQRFLHHSTLLYVEVTARTRSIAPGMMQMLIGRLYGLQEQQLHMLRVQLS